jgi:ElaB/YqjD/DUF883 family membrane-anchored ribosome-binding protein
MNKTNNGNGTAAPLDSIRDSVKGLVEQGHDKVNAIKDAASDLQHKVTDGGGKAIDNASKLIKDHPFAAVGIAFGVGYILMRMFR